MENPVHTTRVTKKLRSQRCPVTGVEEGGEESLLMYTMS